MEFDKNRTYKIKEMCEMVGVDYNKNHPKDSLKKIKYQYEIQQISKQKFKVIRELSPLEKAEVRLYSDCKRLLETAIYITLSEAREPKKIRGNIKDFFKLFHITNENYRYFTYERMTENKVEIIKKLEFSDYDVNVVNLLLYQFTEDVNPILRKIVLETFHKMEDESYLILNKYRMFGGKVNTGDGNSVGTVNQSTPEEDEIYITIRREIMEREGYNEWSKVPYYTRGHTDKEICRRMGYDYSFYEYEIILNQSGLQRKVENENLTKVLTELNYSISHKLENSQQGNLKTTSPNVKKDCIEGLIISKPL